MDKSANIRINNKDLSAIIIYPEWDKEKKNYINSNISLIIFEYNNKESGNMLFQKHISLDLNPNLIKSHQQFGSFISKYAIDNLKIDIREFMIDKNIELFDII